MKPVLYVGNRNYSSWSLRPWLVLTWAGIEFETHALPLGGPGYMQRRVPRVLAINPSGTVPALHVGDDVIADSLAISEGAAEKKPGLWPTDPGARAQARSAACEMQSSFGALRSTRSSRRSRFRTYGVTLSEGAAKYSSALLENPAFLAWERDAKAEEWTMPEWDEA